MNSRAWTILGVAALGLNFIPSARAVTGCTNDWLNGDFALPFSGMASPAAGRLIGAITVPANTPTSSALSATGIARLKLTPDGNISGYSWANLEGSWVQTANLTGTYMVNTDCTLSFNLSDASGNMAQFGGVIVGQGDSVLLTQTDAGAAISGRMKHVRTICQTSDITGSFGVQYTGDLLGSNGGMVNSTGTISLDGNGGANAAESRFTAGKYAQTMSSGTITVNPDCSFSLALMAADGSSVNFAGLITFDSTQVPQPLLVRSDAGTAVSGSMIAQ